MARKKAPAKKVAKRKKAAAPVVVAASPESVAPSLVETGNPAYGIDLPMRVMVDSTVPSITPSPKLIHFPIVYIHGEDKSVLGQVVFDSYGREIRVVIDSVEYGIRTNELFLMAQKVHAARMQRKANK